MRNVQLHGILRLQKDLNAGNQKEDELKEQPDQTEKKIRITAEGSDFMPAIRRQIWLGPNQDPATAESPKLRLKHRGNPFEKQKQLRMALGRFIQVHPKPRESCARAEYPSA